MRPSPALTLSNVALMAATEPQAQVLTPRVIPLGSVRAGLKLLPLLYPLSEVEGAMPEPGLEDVKELAECGG